MNIAIGIAQGLRYMHEQCPRGPVVHGDLRPCNILLGHNLQPQITGFGHAKWLEFEESSPTSSNRLIWLRFLVFEHEKLWAQASFGSKVIGINEIGHSRIRVLSLLKGEMSCAKQTFPSTESSPSM
ncbi:Protein kinase, catalytic domain-containing protein, partial [Cynara cardunculus var. scolymus]